jgi:hypothetical protein
VSDPTPDSTEPEVVETPAEMTALTTVLNKVRPTVVVRRRVYEVAREAAPSPGFVDMDDDEDGPPSSVNVARALASLRGEELRRLEEILSESETEMSIPVAEPIEPDDEPAPAATPNPPSVKTIGVGSTITVPELAKRLGVATGDLVTTLVAAGYFSTTAKSSLSRADATTAAWMFGFTVEAVDDEPAKKRSGASKKK